MSTSPVDQPGPGGQDDAPTPPTMGRRVGSAMGRAARGAAHGTRETIRRNPTADKVYRTGVGVVGGSTVALGVVLMPLPGPGALIALGGRTRRPRHPLDRVRRREEGQREGERRREEGVRRGEGRPRAPKGRCHRRQHCRRRRLGRRLSACTPTGVRGANGSPG
jgi:hypothetical protein